MKNSKILLILFLISFSFIAKGQVSYEPDETLIYKTTPQTTLKLHVFKPEKHKKKDKRPVVVFFFGGGWSGGSPKQFYQQARYFSERGIVAISAEYRVFKKHNTTPFDCVRDAKSAIRWVRVHASELGIDPDRVIASGGSAGGHLAACTGVIEGNEEVGEELKVSSVPNAMLLFNPVIDTTEKGYGLKKVGEARKTEISPCSHVREGIVPTLIFHGTADKTVPFENVQRFTKLMNEVGNSCELIAYEGEGHGFFNGSFFRKKNTDVIFNSTMEKAMEFFKELKFIYK
ncbi:alpha/beta hydrolase [Winogradskyella sp. F6397]|uniref:Alpha/beta hydrolase n=1 Tax=Winogradskyella marina TaxID=2785530 RepID=A0ABS0EER8_9FLAO|nr:alpha/beta hydrolase [Winogradskyella marina]MBF8148743.1 alpha/beta hydrolase [Winogradskyella marina]